MEKLREDISFISILLSVNMILQLAGDASAKTFGVITVVILSLIMAFVSVVSMIKKEDKKIQYGFIIYLTTYLICNIVLGIAGAVNLINVFYGLVWILTISAYIISLSHPVISNSIVSLSLISTFIVQWIDNIEIKESFNSISGLLLISVVALAVNIVYTKKKVTGLKNIALYERQPLKIKLWSQIIVWSLIVTSVSYVARTQLYGALGTEMKYVILASASVMITTFLTIGAITTSVLVVELFAAYVVLEWYTMSYIVFIADYNWGIEFATVMIDTALLGYLIAKYRRQTKRHEIQKEKNLV